MKTPLLRAVVATASLVLAACGETPVPRNTACMKMYDLSGPVKKCEVTTYEADFVNGTYRKKAGADEPYVWICEFNKAGYLTRDGNVTFTYKTDTIFIDGSSRENPEMIRRLKYDTEGRIVKQSWEYRDGSVGEAQGFTTNKFNASGLLMHDETSFWEGSDENTYTYDADGTRTGQKYIDYYYDEETVKTYAYEYLKWDDRGNWIERGAKIHSTIYTTDDLTSRRKITGQKDACQLQVRKISYY